MIPEVVHLISLVINEAIGPEFLIPKVILVMIDTWSPDIAAATANRYQQEDKGMEYRPNHDL